MLNDIQKKVIRQFLQAPINAVKCPHFNNALKIVALRAMASPRNEIPEAERLLLEENCLQPYVEYVRKVITQFGVQGNTGDAFEDDPDLLELLLLNDPGQEITQEDLREFIATEITNEIDAYFPPLTVRAANVYVNTVLNGDESQLNDHKTATPSPPRIPAAFTSETTKDLRITQQQLEAMYIVNLDLGTADTLLLNDLKDYTGMRFTPHQLQAIYFEKPDAPMEELDRLGFKNDFNAILMQAVIRRHKAIKIIKEHVPDETPWPPKEYPLDNHGEIDVPETILRLYTVNPTLKTCDLMIIRSFGFDLLQSLYEITTQEINDDLAHIFFCLLYGGDLNGLKYVWNITSPEEKRILLSEVDENDCCYLMRAVTKGHLHVLQWLHEIAPPEAITQMIDDAGVNLKSIAKKGNLPVMKWWWATANTEQRTKLQQTDDIVKLYKALYSGHLPFVKGFISVANDWQKTDMQEFIWRKIPTLLEHGHLNVLLWASEKIKIEFYTNTLFPEITGTLAIFGHLALLQWVLRQAKANEPQEASGGAAKHGLLHIPNWLCGVTHHDSLAYSINTAFFKAATSGHLNIMQWIWERENAYLEKGLLIRSFVIAAKNGHLHVLQWIWEQDNIHIEDEVLHKLFLDLATFHHLDELKWIWATHKSRISPAVLKVAFCLAAQNSYIHIHVESKKFTKLHVLQWLFVLLSDNEKTTLISRVSKLKNDWDLLEAKWFLEVSNWHQRPMILNMIVWTKQNWTLEEVKWYWAIADGDQKKELLSRAFLCYTYFNDNNFTEWLLVKANSETLNAMVSAAFLTSSLYGHITASALVKNRRIVKIVKTEIQTTIRNEAFWVAIGLERLPRLKFTFRDLGFNWPEAWDAENINVESCWQSATAEQQSAMLYGMFVKELYSDQPSEFWHRQYGSTDQHAAIMNKIFHEITDRKPSVKSMNFVWRLCSPEQQRLLVALCLQKKNINLFEHFELEFKPFPAPTPPPPLELHEYEPEQNEPNLTEKKRSQEVDDDSDRPYKKLAPDADEADIFAHLVEGINEQPDFDDIFNEDPADSNYFRM